MDTYARSFRAIDARLARAAKRSYRRGRRWIRCARNAMNPLVNVIFHREHLIECAQEMRQNGSDAAGSNGERLRDYSRENLIVLCDSLHQDIYGGSYEPSPRRTVKIPKRSGKGHRTIKISTPADRIVGNALLQAMTPIWEPRFLENNWGFRPGKNQWDMLAWLRIQVEATGRTVLALDDVANAFDNIPLKPLLDWHVETLQPLVPECHKQASRLRDLRRFCSKGQAELVPATQSPHHELQRLRELIRQVVQDPANTTSRGIDQGGCYSPLAMNVFLHHSYDIPMAESLFHPYWARYVDNLVYLAQDVPQGRKALQMSAQLLEPYGLRLKGEDGIFDLERGACPNLLGFKVAWKNGKLQYRLSSQSWDQLSAELRQLHKGERAPERATATIRGWVQAMGPAFEGGDDVSDRLLRLSASLGFREAATESDISSWSLEAANRWSALLRDSLEGTAEGARATAPPVPPPDLN